jgi:hypothetical protein
MARVVFAGCLLLAALLYLPDLLTNKNRQRGQAGVVAVAKSGVQAATVVATAVKSNYTEPVQPPDPVEVQTKALIQVSETLEKMPAAIAESVARASARQLDDVNRRLAQQDAANAKTAEVAQATVTTLGKVVERIDRLDTAIQGLKDERTKAAASPREEVKPDAEVPKAKEQRSSSQGPNVSFAPAFAPRSESGAIVIATAPPLNNIMPKIVLEEYEAQQRSSRTGRR